MRPRGTGGRLPPLRLLQVTTLVSTLDRFVMPPMLIAIARDLGVPLSQAVQAAGVYFLAYGLLQPAWGMVSDRLGLVRTMRLTLLLAAVSTTAAAFVTTPVALGITRGLTGGFFGAAYPSSLIYIGDTVPAQSRHRQVTHLMVGTALGTTLASVGGGALAQLLSWRIAFLVTGAAALLLTFALRNLEEPPRTRTGRHVVSTLVRVVRSGPARLVLALAFAEGAVLLGALTLLPPAVEEAGASASVAGAATAGYGIAVFGFAWLVGHLSRKVHPSRLIGLGALAAFAACALMAVSRSAVLALGVAVLLGLAWTAMHSSLQTWATEVIPDARATVVSLFAGALFVGSAVAAVAVAGLAEADRYGVIFLMGAVTSIPLGVLATFGRATWRRPEGQ